MIRSHTPIPTAMPTMLCWSSAVCGMGEGLEVEAPETPSAALPVKPLGVAVSVVVNVVTKPPLDETRTEVPTLGKVVDAESTELIDRELGDDATKVVEDTVPVVDSDSEALVVEEAPVADVCESEDSVVVVVVVGS
jgi:hypothetical protein